MSTSSVNSPISKERREAILGGRTLLLGSSNGNESNDSSIKIPPQPPTPEYLHPDPTKRKRWTWEAEKDYFKKTSSYNKSLPTTKTNIEDEEPWSNSHLLNFQLLKTRIKLQGNHIYKCLEVNCTKNTQGGCLKLCKKHYSQYMICTKQVETWQCICGEVVMELNSKCGKCHRWKT